MILASEAPNILVVMTPVNAKQLWPEAKKFLKTAVPYMTNQLTLERIYQMATVEERAMIFALVDTEARKMRTAAMITLVYSEINGEKQVCANVELCGGDDNFADVFEWGLSSINGYLKEKHKVYRSRIIGRPGWWVKLRNLGYKPTHFFAEMDL